MWYLKCPLILKTLTLLLVTGARSQEVSTPSSLLAPRNFNHHPFDAVQFLKSLKGAEPTKQGPVVFPNDAPPPPRPPLIVTARPLTESIARSELNNTVASQSQLHGFLARIKDYRPFVPAPSFDYNISPSRTPYADVVAKNRYQSAERDNRYNDYEERTILPPIYKALEDHAKQNVLKINEKTKYNYQNYQPEYNNKYQNNEIDDTSADNDHNKNYAFSYTVKDQKTGDDFSHSQHSRGSATNGEYRVRLPDGRMQIVSYIADENGYKADVRYDEEKSVGNNIENDYGHNYSPNNYAYNDYREDTSRNDIDNHHEHNNNYAPKTYEHNTYPNNNYVPNHNIDYNNQNPDYNDRSNNNNKFTDKIKPVDEKDDYYYPDNSREYYNDYSSEYNINNRPYKSKFAAFTPTAAATSASVTPNYKLLQDLLVTKDAYKTEQNYDRIDINIPSSTPSPYEGTTEHVVVITTKTPNLYTNVRNSLNLGPGSNYNSVIEPSASYNTDISPRVILATTPKSYLVSTIASLKNKIHFGTKPILSDSYVDKINKYLTFN